MLNRIVCYGLALNFLVLVSTLRGDISARTESVIPNLVLESSLNGSFGEALIDAAQLGLALSSLVSGDSLIISSALSGIGAGMYSAPVNRVYAAYTAIQETAQLLQAIQDKAIHAEGVMRVSKDSRYGAAVVTFRAKSDDDSFGHIDTAVYRTQGIQVNTAGVGTREGFSSVKFDLRSVPPGMYPIVFFAKETDCSICLSIAHTVLVDVYAPCPALGSVCRADVASYYQVWDALNAQRRRTQAIVTNGSRAIGRIKLQENACYRSRGRITTGGGSSPEARARAEQEFANCINRVEALDQQLQGSCPGLAYAATEAQCSALRNRDASLVPFYRAVDGAVAKIRTHNCCHEQVNPTGGTGPNFTPIPRPPIAGPRPPA